MIKLKLFAYRSALGGDALLYLDHAPANPVCRWFWNIEPLPVYALNVLLREVTYGDGHQEER